MAAAAQEPDWQAVAVKAEGREGARVTTKIKCAVVGATLLGFMSTGALALSPSAQRGLTIARTNCARCHSIGKVGESPLKIAPPFRTLHEPARRVRFRPLPH